MEGNEENYEYEYSAEDQPKHRGWVYAIIALLAIAAVAGGALYGLSQRETDADRASSSLEEGLAAHRADRLDDATQSYNDALRFDPRNKLAFYNLGLIAQTRQDPVTAGVNYRMTLSIDPRYVPALFNLGIVETSQGNSAEAIDLYRRVIALEPDHAGAHLNLGLLLRATGRRAEGNREIATARRLDPSLTATTTPSPSPTPGG